MTHSINVPLVREVLAQIHAAPRRWTQNQWLDRPYEEEEQAPTDTVDNCETTGCFAGWAAVLAGYKTDREGRLTAAAIPSPIRDRIAETFDLADDSWYLPAFRRPFMVRHVAGVELGLTEEQARALFDSRNTLRRLYELLNEWTEGEISEPGDLPDWADIEPDDLDLYWRDLDCQDSEAAGS